MPIFVNQDEVMYQALEANAAIMGALLPPSQGGSWAFPTQASDINFEQLPVMISAIQVNTPVLWNRKGQSLLKHQWTMEFLVLVAEGLTMTSEDAARAELETNGWVTKVMRQWAANMSLSNTVEVIGDTESGTRQLATYQMGNIIWESPIVHWGIRFLLPVSQVHQMEMKP